MECKECGWLLIEHAIRCKCCLGEFCSSCINLDDECRECSLPGEEDDEEETSDEGK